MSQRDVAAPDGSLLSGDGQDSRTARMFLRGVGVPDAVIRRRPVIGIAASWSDFVPCNLHHRELALAVRRGVADAGGVAFEFPTISLGEPFMRPSSMYLRNLMSMDVEEMIRASPIDGVVLIGGCDKTIPAQLMGACSAGKPAVVVASGPRREGFCLGKRRSIDDLWPILDAVRGGDLDQAAWAEVEAGLNDGPGTCNVMGTASTMAAVAECLGFSVPGSAWAPATSGTRVEFAEQAGRQAVQYCSQGIRPRDLVTGRSIMNAHRVIAAIGGSTNALIHLAAIAGRAGIELQFEQVTEWLSTTPLVLNVRPTGEGSLDSAHTSGGVPRVMAGFTGVMSLDSLCGSGRTWRQFLDAQAVSAAPAPGAGPAVALLRGSLAPGGAVLKRAGAAPRLLRHTGQAHVFDGLEDLFTRIDDESLALTQDSVIVLRGVGPTGGPGMPEVGHLPIPQYLQRQGVTDMLRVSDARMSGTASGACVLHVVPEAAVGGPLALVRDNDLISIDVTAGRIELLVPVAELQSRSAGPTPAVPRRGYSRLHQMHVTQADKGCDFDFLIGAD
jgi:dihydroxy-acid dehydratase